jgi:hypothetical protein
MTEEREAGEEKIPSYYEMVKANDIITFVRPLLEQGGYKLRDGDGKIWVDTFMAFHTPWHHVHHADGLDCHTWHKILFDVIFQRFGMKYIPSKCQSCWKVVVRMATLKQLHALLGLQQRMGRPSKCGIEVRDTVNGLYGGYFYNHSLGEGLECYEAVRAAIDVEPELGPDVFVILKRACTEFELSCGPSDEWKVTPEQAQIEALVNKWFVRDIMQRTQPSHAIATVHRRWIEWAYQCGDQTYLEYTNGVPIFPKVISYHHLAEKPPEEKEEIFNRLNTGELHLKDLKSL